MVVGDRRIAALDALFERLDRSERARDPLAIAREIDDTYVILLFACGHAALGDTDRALAMERDARTLIGADREDPVHNWLLRAFAYRVRALALPRALLDELDRDDRVQRYKIDRFLDASRLLAPEPRVEALARFSSYDRVAAANRSALGTLHRLDIEGALASQELIDRLVLSLVELGHLDPEHVAIVLARIAPWLPRISRPRRAFVHASIARLSLAAADVHAACAALGEDDDERTLTTLAAIARDAPHLAPAIAAALATLPDTRRSSAAYRLACLRSGTRPTLADAQSLTTSGLLLEAVLDGFLALPFAERFHEPWPEALYGNVIERMGTTSHYTYWVIHVVDQIVRSIVEEPA